MSSLCSSIEALDTLISDAKMAKLIIWRIQKALGDLVIFNYSLNCKVKNVTTLTRYFRVIYDHLGNESLDNHIDIEYFNFDFQRKYTNLCFTKHCNLLASSHSMKLWSDAFLLFETLSRAFLLSIQFGKWNIWPPKKSSYYSFCTIFSCAVLYYNSFSSCLVYRWCN